MVRIDRVVTRGGDGGETSLGDGTRVSKADPRIEAIGAVDEANAAIEAHMANFMASSSHANANAWKAAEQRRDGFGKPWR